MNVFKKVLAVVGAGLVLAAAVPTFADAAQKFQEVIVANEDSDPVPVAEQNLDADGNIRVHEQGTVAVQEVREPFQRSSRFDNWGGKEFRSFSSISVPEGKMLIVEKVSFRVAVEPGQQVHARVSFQGADLPGAVYVPMEFQGTFDGKDVYVGAETVTAYAAGTNAPVLATAVRSSTSGNGGAVEFSLIGYFVDSP